MNGCCVGCRQQTHGCSFKEEIAKVASLFDRRFCEPDRRDPLRKIRNCKVFRICNVGNEMFLCSTGWFGRALGRSACSYSNPQSNRARLEHFYESMPALCSGDQNIFIVRLDLKGKSEWIEGVPKRKRGSRQHRVPKDHGATARARTLDLFY
jgi:hypothetical protein